jgi:hypothetical protein
MNMQTVTRRELIVRFLQQSVAVAAVIWVMILLLRRAELAAMPIPEAMGLAAGQLISAVPFGMMLTAAAWGFRTVLRWVLRGL